MFFSSYTSFSYVQYYICTIQSVYFASNLVLYLLNRFHFLLYLNILILTYNKICYYFHDGFTHLVSETKTH